MIRSCLLICGVLIWLIGCAPSAEEQATGTLDFLDANGETLRTIQIDIAATPEQRQRGLMDRRDLSLQEGMLFIFPAADSQSFWMRNTYIPLDIMFVGTDRKIVNIAKRTVPLSDDYIKSTGLAQYVVEVRGGFSDRFGIDESVTIRWQQDSQ